MSVCLSIQHKLVTCLEPRGTNLSLQLELTSGDFKLDLNRTLRGIQVVIISVVPSWDINMNNWNLGKPYFKFFKLIQGISFFLQVYWIFIFWYQLLIISWLNFYFHINLIKPGLSLVSVGLKNSQFLSNRTNNWSLFHSHKRCVS